MLQHQATKDKEKTLESNQKKNKSITLKRAIIRHVAEFKEEMTGVKRK